MGSGGNTIGAEGAAAAATSATSAAAAAQGPGAAAVRRPAVADVSATINVASMTSLPWLPPGQVHCAQRLDGNECIMQQVPIVVATSRHRCKGPCKRDIHAACGQMLDDDQEMDRTCDRCVSNDDGAPSTKRQRTTTTSVIVPDPKVSPHRSAAWAGAAQNLQKQGRTMQRRSQVAQGGHLNLPLGLVVRFNVDKYDRTKLDASNMMVVVVKQPGATVYTVATHAGYLEKNISRSYLIVPPSKIDPVIVKLGGVVERFDNGELDPLGVRMFARSASLTGGPGMVKCGCGGKGKCTSCKCSKAGRFCTSSCNCSHYAMCKNTEPTE
jgi:hypothetical protein